MATFNGTTTPTTIGASGDSNQLLPGVRGTNSNSGAANGVEGTNTGAGGSGVFGSASNAASYGVAGFNQSTIGSGGAGVYGNSSNANLAGVYGFCSAGKAVFGNTNSGNGVYGAASTSSGHGVAGYNTNNTGGGGIAVYGNSSTGTAVQGDANGETGVGVEGNGTNIGVSGASNSIGCEGESGSGVGVSGSATSGYGVYGTSSSNYAGYFAGNLAVTGNANVTGTVFKGSGGFLIDHPLDPTNKDLVHSFVESPEMKNIYDGKAVSDAQGEFVVQLPAYFEALNTDFRYQLTPVGAPAPNLHVKEELNAGRFVVGGATPGQSICWQVTGNRKDPWALASSFQAEKEKNAKEKGLYRHPRAYGQPESKGIGWEDAQRVVALRRRSPRIFPAPTT